MVNVLVVEDNHDVRTSIKVSLYEINNNYEFFEAHDYKTCISMLEKNNVDVILMDIMLGNVDGIEIAKKIKQNSNYKNIRIVFLTARSDDETKNNSAFIGEDYVEKPFVPKELDAVIKKALSRRSPVYLKDK